MGFLHLPTQTYAFLAFFIFKQLVISEVGSVGSVGSVFALIRGFSESTV